MRVSTQQYLLIPHNKGQMNTGHADLDAFLEQNAEAKAAYERNLSDAARKGAQAISELAKKSSDETSAARENAANANFPWYVPLLGLTCKAQAKWETSRYIC